MNSLEIPLLIFPDRLAFCDLYQRMFLIVYYMDIVCDFIMIADMVVSLVTIVPKVCPFLCLSMVACVWLRTNF